MLPEKILEYARFHGLATDPCTLDPLKEFLASNPIPNHLEHELRDPPEAEPLPKDLITPSLLQEKILVSQEAVKFFAQCIKPSKPQTIYCDGFERRKSLRVTPPLLLTDPELDVHEYLAEFHRQSEQRISLESVPFLGDYEENLSWPLGFYNLAEDLNRQIAREKLDSTKEVLRYIHKTINGKFSPKTERDIRATPTTLSPPLLPLEEPIAQYIPPLEMMELQLLSDKTDPDEIKLQEMKEYVASLDSIKIDTSDLGDPKVVQKLLDGVQCPPACPSMRDLNCGEETRLSEQRKSTALKLEPPIMPLEHNGGSAENGFGVPSSKVLHDEISKSSTDDLEIENMQDLLNDEHLGHMARLALERIDRNIRAERINNIHLTTKLNVPPLKSPQLAAPWSVESEERQLPANLCPMLTLENLVSHWQDSSAYGNSADTDLRWVPYRSVPLTSVTREIIVDSEHYLENALNPNRSVLKSKDLLRKPEKPRILIQDHRCEESKIEEDVELAAKVPEPIAPNSKQRIMTIIPAKRPAPKSTKAVMENDHFRELSRRNQSNQQHVTDSLPSFMLMRGVDAKKKTLNATTSKFFSKPQTPPQPSEIQAQATPEPRRPTDSHSNLALQPSISPPKLSFSQQHTLILHTSLLSKYSSLIHRLELHQPRALRLIFRDPLDLKTPFSTSPEALPDILLSPTVGVLFTATQHLIQRSLPGQSTFGPSLHARVRSLKDKIEHLFILTICEIADAHVDATISSAVAELTALGTSLGPDFALSLILIPPMTQANAASALPKSANACNQRPEHFHHLLNWILTLTERHGYSKTPQQSIGAMLDEETIWEVWLRVAGLNPYAAQIVAGMLKGQNGDTATSYGFQAMAEGDMQGLRQFVHMAMDQRENAFGRIIGKNALRRINQVVDQRWDDGIVV
ncbi:MAG: hypothetical protein Q9227_006129 [Pyrenula ochraceoflavens]